MRQIFLFLVGIITLCAGCAESNRDTSLYQRSGRAKPIVTVLPMVDRAGNGPVAAELTDLIRSRIFDSPQLYLLKERGSLEAAKKLSQPSPHHLAKLAVENLGATEFVVVTELVEADESPLGQAKSHGHFDEHCASLNLTTRLRILDIRGEEPQVILQELVHHEAACTQSQSRVAREIVARIESYVGAIKG